MVPFIRFVPTRAAFARVGPAYQAVPHRHRSYAALRLPDILRPRLRFPSPLAYLVASAFFFIGFRVHSRTRAVGDWGGRLPRGPHLTRKHQGLPGYEVVLFVRATVNHHAGRVATIMPSCRRRPCCLQAFRNLGLTPEVSLFAAAFSGPHVRLHTHQRRRYRRRCKAGYQPAGLSFGWAGFAPAGRLIQIFKVASSTSYSNWTRIAWSHPKAGIQSKGVLRPEDGSPLSRG